MEKREDKEEMVFGLWDYIKDYKGLYGLFLLFILILTLVFYAYRLPVEAVLYGSLLCLSMALPILAWHYQSLKKKLGTIKRMKQAFLREPNQYYLDRCPLGFAVLEREYQSFLRLLEQDRERIRSQAQAQREEITDYYTMWTHQIKTPIAAMSLLLQGREDDPYRELREQLFKIEEYVNMALQYMRLDSDHDLIIQWCDLDGILRQAVHKYAPMFIRKKLTLSYKPLNCKVLTDEKWMVFVVEQLLSNAVKYTKEGGISIDFEREPETALVIRDTGIGIAWEDQPRIFEKGFTGCNGHANKSSTGIGLYLCQRILKRLSNKISVKSEPGKGSEFRISLETVSGSILTKM